jgi:hypothetical protein
MNSLNNSISGITYLRKHELQPGIACTVNGAIGQLSVQAADFSILAIALVTILTITRNIFMPRASRQRKIIICLSVWIVPIVTTIFATSLGQITPVSGNWCWISKSRPDLRYALTHGWRFAIIFTTIVIYLYIWWYLGRYFRSVVNTFGTMFGSNEQGSNVKSTMLPVHERNSSISIDESMPKEGIDGSETYLSVSTLYSPAENRRKTLSAGLLYPTELEKPPRVQRANTSPLQQVPNVPNKRLSKRTRTITYVEFPIREQTRHVEREIKRMMLLNAYPIMYVLLWIPGLMNRLLEASGNPPQGGLLSALQCSSQFIGLANAITYGLSRQIRHRLKEDLLGWWPHRNTNHKASRKEITEF